MTQRSGSLYPTVTTWADRPLLPNLLEAPTASVLPDQPDLLHRSPADQQPHHVGKIKRFNSITIAPINYRHWNASSVVMPLTLKIKWHLFFFFLPFFSPASSSSSSPSELSECPASEGSSQASASGSSNQPDELGAAGTAAGTAAAAGSLQVSSGPKPATSSSAARTPTTPRVAPMNGPLPPG